jgi:hypothetical protein
MSTNYKTFIMQLQVSNYRGHKVADNVSRLCAGGDLEHESFNPPLNLI